MPTLRATGTSATSYMASIAWHSARFFRIAKIEIFFDTQVPKEIGLHSRL
jgi:hypothetical protein